MTRGLVFAVALSLLPHDSAVAADPVDGAFPIVSKSSSRTVVRGRVTVVDGRTLWFPVDKMLVQLRDIDSCELVQWSFDPKATPATAPSLAPVPCGALAKAWLRRATGNSAVTCAVISDGQPLEAKGVCKVGRRDIALEMLLVGWAKVNAAGPHDRRYVQAQNLAVTARYGMWGTYVLDMPEWRDKAIDKTLGRKPQADINLLSERNSEISPPFLDARRQPKRRDR